MLNVARALVAAYLVGVAVLLAAIVFVNVLETVGK